MRHQLTRFDEFPRHQIGGSFDMVADGSPHWSDGYYFTMGDDAGRFAWFMGFRLHPNTDVLDAFVCVSADGQQHNMRWSRRLRPNIDDLECGPLSVQVIEGLRTLRTICAPNEWGQSFDLTWTGWAPPYNEDRVIVIVNGRVQSDRSNFDQCSLVSGWFEVAGQRVDVNDWTGVRDHSWGIGNSTGGPRSSAIAPAPVSAPSPAPATPSALEMPRTIGLRQWCVFRMPDRVLFWQFHHPGGDGTWSKFESQCMFPYGDPRQPFAYVDVTHRMRWRDDGSGPMPRMADGEVHLTRADGGVERYRIEPISYPVYLQGGGYHRGYDDGLGRGVYRGEFVSEGEVWQIDRGIGVVEPKGVRLEPHHYAEAWGRCTNLDDPTDLGTGHLECVLLAPSLDRFSQ